MLKKIKYKDITWIDLESPTPAELEEVATTYKLHPLAVGELAAPSLRSKVDVYSDFIYLVLHFPDHEVDFILGNGFIITTHYESMPVLGDFGKILESDFGAKQRIKSIHSGFIFYYIVREIYEEIDHGLDLINSRLRSIEQQVFAAEGRRVVAELADISRQLLDFRWALKSHREVLASLETAGKDFYGATFGNYIQSLSGEHARVWRAIQSNRSTFLDLRETNDSLLTIQTNETIKVLTVTAFIFLPLTILSQLFGMNTTNAMPFVDSQYDFYYILGLMILTVGLSYYFARRRRWL